MQVHHGAFDIGMSHHFLHGDDVYAIFEQVSGIGMAQHMGVHFFDDASLLSYCFHCPLHATLAVTPVEAFAFRITCTVEEKGCRALCRNVFFDAPDEVFT